MQEYENIGLGLDASVVSNVVSKLPLMQTPNYHIVIGNCFTSSALLRHLSATGVAAKGMVRANQMENASLQDMVKTEQREAEIIRCGY